MGRKRDRFWDYAEELDRRFRCNFCKRDFAGGIPRLKSHLSGFTCRGIDVCSEVPEEVRDAAVSAIGNPFKKVQTFTSSNNILVHSKSISASSPCLAKGLNQDDSSKKSEMNNKVNEKLTKFLVSNNIDFDVVGTQSFVELMKVVAECDLNYKPQCSLTLQTWLKTKVEMYIKNVKKTWDTTGCAIMLQKLSNFVIAFAYSPNGAVFLESYDIVENQVKNYDIVCFVSSLIEDVGANHVVMLITSNDSIFCSLDGALISRYPHIYNIHCVVHEIHSLLKTIYCRIEWVQQLVVDAELIVNYMYENEKVLSLTRQCTKSKELKHQYMMANFTSYYQMLQSVVDGEGELKRLVASEEWGLLDCNKTEIAIKVANLIQGWDFWIQGRECLKVLYPLIQVLRLVEDDGSTLGYLYEALERARDAILEHQKNDVKYRSILELFDICQSKMNHPIHAVAAFLNPSYMYHNDNYFKDTKVKQGIDFILQRLVAEDEKKNFAKEVQLYHNKVSSLFTEMAKTMLETSHPRVWWEYCGDCLPTLKKYAIRVLSQPSKCSFVHKYPDVARTLKVQIGVPERQDNYMTVNSLIMDKFKAWEERCLEPIGLKNCSELPDYTDFVKIWGQDEELEGNSRLLTLLKSHLGKNGFVDAEEIVDFEPLWT